MSVDGTEAAPAAEVVAAPPHYREAGAALWRVIAPARRILCPFHINADPDAVGSALGMRHLLTALGKEVTVVASDGDFPAITAFLPGADGIARYRGGPLPPADLLLALDSSDLERLGDLSAANAARFAAGPVVDIDHHVTNTRFGTGGANFVDPAAAATAEIVYLLARAWDLPVGRETATCLLAGVYGDTLGLQTPSTSPRTARVVADLLAAGADLPALVDNFYRSRPYKTAKLWGLVLASAAWCGRVLWSEVTPDMLAEAGAEENDTGGVINFLSGVQGARVTALLYRGAHEWRAGLRSPADGVDVAAIAARFGGGGHPRAAGCRIAGDEAARDAFLRTVDEMASRAVGRSGGRAAGLSSDTGQ
ncbi:MAG TPA: DHH family phosphoesterase [Thermomicrobiales bacterium]|nr:DHH family phosphoesterase [Thermomicrobiales bacterium]